MMHGTCVLSNASQKRIAHLNNDIKGGNSVRNEMANNKGDFRDGVCLKPLNGFELKSLCAIVWTYRLLMKVKSSGIFQGGPL